MSATLEKTGESALAPAENAAPSVRRIAWPQMPWATLLPYLGAVFLLAALARPVLADWIETYTKPESYYAHGPIIPLLVALMFWYRRDALRAVVKKPCCGALSVLLPALALLIWADKVEARAVAATAFLLIIWSSVWLALGTRFLRAAAFPLGFILLMAPLPGPLLNDATQRLQMLSTQNANSLLHGMTFATSLQGNVITMDNFTFSVDVPCSGFKLFLSLLTFSAAFAYLVDGEAWKRVLLFLFSMPLSLVVNAVRIALIGVVGDCISGDAAHIFHDWSGMLTLVLGFVALFSLAKGFGCRKFAGWAIF